MICFTSVRAPFGTVIVTEEESFITGLFLTVEDFEEWRKDAPGVKPCETALLSEAKQQLASYFSGERKQFSLPLRQKGTPFQERVWNALTMIPYGESRSYGDMAEAIGKPKAVRAIGQANKRNRLPILIPCHRVIGKNSALTGYAGTKTDVKAVLLNIEQISYKEK
ncbi:methylated-DNA--[protein]-cysteine S-methyltransferase [Bacillus velezensis]|uniref:Methylated-DNA--protein-cysteine methyltransferase n=1 Tax=Bacillus amyloliquefaciens TaxID=1390 RepID=A0AAP4DI69_BACAM|nr:MULTISPECIES: methylated-DNA--[protein]-cysteine S-methyltransferase [Bacillus]ATY27990.1 cysteine methyltransferase [Bacillus velezensis]AWQ16602.1 cysteine methyltransferase [Bacillus velezensis]ERH59040.1 O6-alkylguanine DNA alkyltransferase [Bacillus amyloliquefaciens EGD-AQ14]MBL4961265.1 methylated-DNA--[protein]-cysteine S-methyltransferase [Bacillus velezensis]MBU0443519.1 methylated-DNA--[protein]-cysteine S-methyltransferase [Bacillus amyloliquefaciens]